MMLTVMPQKSGVESSRKHVTSVDRLFWESLLPRRAANRQISGKNQGAVAHSAKVSTLHHSPLTHHPFTITLHVRKHSPLAGYQSGGLHVLLSYPRITIDGLLPVCHQHRTFSLRPLLRRRDLRNPEPNPDPRTLQDRGKLRSADLATGGWSALNGRTVISARL